MTNDQFKNARIALGLTIQELSEILNTHPKTVRRWEANNKSKRKPNPIACVLVKAMLDGSYKPQ